MFNFIFRIIAHIFTLYNSCKDKDFIFAGSKKIASLPCDENSQKNKIDNAYENEAFKEKDFEVFINNKTCEFLLKNLGKIFSEDFKNVDKFQERVINNMSLMNSILTNCSNLAVFTKPIVNDIIFIAKEKFDLLRKNSALLLAKIAKASDEMEKFVRNLHGVEVIMNIAKFIKLDK